MSKPFLQVNHYVSKDADARERRWNGKSFTVEGLYVEDQETLGAVIAKFDSYWDASDFVTEWIQEKGEKGDVIVITDDKGILSKETVLYARR